MLECPWSTNQLKKLSRHIRDGTDVPASLPSYGEVMVWYNDIAVAAQTELEGLPWDALLPGRQVEITSRPKTIDTLRQKLQRDPGTPLPSVQDVAGVRIESEMLLHEQTAVALAIAEQFGEDEASVRDLRLTPHSGYRAVHVWLHTPVRVEVQVRTHLQGLWANTYESVADVVGREIRYGSLPAEPAERAAVEAMQSISLKQIAKVEEYRDRYGILQGAEPDEAFARAAGAPPLAEETSEFWEMFDADLRQSLQSLRDRFLNNRTDGGS